MVTVFIIFLFCVIIIVVIFFLFLHGYVLGQEVMSKVV